MTAMKWWGWGNGGVEFTHEDKPALAPFIARAIAVDVRTKHAAPVRFEELEIPDPGLPAGLRADLEEAVCGRSSRSTRSIASFTPAASRFAI